MKNSQNISYVERSVKTYPFCLRLIRSLLFHQTSIFLIMFALYISLLNIPFNIVSALFHLVNSLSHFGSSC